MICFCRLGRLARLGRLMCRHRLGLRAALLIPGRMVLVHTALHTLASQSFLIKPQHPRYVCFATPSTSHTFPSDTGVAHLRASLVAWVRMHCVSATLLNKVPYRSSYLGKKGRFLTHSSEGTIIHDGECMAVGVLRAYGRLGLLESCR